LKPIPIIPTTKLLTKPVAAGWTLFGKIRVFFAPRNTPFPLRGLLRCGKLWLN
jgi:hypothetical protein